MLTPDWSSVWTSQEAEKELNDFRFKGPGIYHTRGGDSLLVVPVDRPREETWHQANKPGEKYNFYVYNCRNIGDILNLLVGAPTRS